MVHCVMFVWCIVGFVRWDGIKFFSRSDFDTRLDTIATKLPVKFQNWHAE